MSNTEQKQKILLKRTTEVDRPSIPSGASHGELFLNIASGANAHNKISTMQIGTNNPIIWSDDVANEKKFALKTEVEALVKEVEDNELVTATAISTMNTSAGFNEDGSSVLEGGVSLSQAIIDLQARAGQDGDGNVITTTYSTKEELSGAVEELSGDVNDIIEEIIDNELVTSTAISTMSASAGFNEDGSSVLEGGVSLSEAIIELQNKTHTYASKTELENLIQEVEDSEFVTATALNQINTSVGLTEGGISQLPNQQTLTEAIIDLQNKTKDLEESDPIFTDSPAAGITGDDIENWDNKLDKDGKAVSAQTADFATDLSGRVEATPEEFTFRPSAGNKSIRDDSATIKRIKGNSVVWNQVAQLRDSGELNGLTFTKENGILRVSGTVTEAFSYDTCILTKYLPQGLKRDGRKYLISINAPDGIAYGINGFPISNTKPHFWSDEAGGVFYGYISIKIPVGTTVDYVFSNPQIIDLTQMFGAGNEPTTVEEFRALYPDSYYPYNTGELRNLDCSGIKTVGFNQWDEQWEQGTLNSVGENDDTSTTIRSKNYTPAIGGTNYYVGIASEGYDNIYYLGISWYDSNKQFISKSYCNQRVVTSPINAAYFRIFTNTNSYVYGNTYNNDICINLHHTGWRDGEYEPYKEVTHALPLSQITNGEPLRKAGSVYDEINETHYIKRVGVVDLGSLTWANAMNNIFACTEMPNMIVTTDIALRLDGLLCTKYAIDTTPSIDATMSDKTMKRKNGWLYIKDTSFTDVASFKASLSGVLLHYELAEPIVTPIETPIDFNYYVEDFGTEEAILAEHSTPFRADIIYQFNATDRIRENSLNIEKLSKTQKDYLPLTGGTMSGQVNSQDIKPVEGSTYQLGDSTYKYKNVFSDFFTGNLEGNAKTATVATDLSGRVEATPEVFTYRPSAGEKSIKDDNAFIRRVKGNSIVWNQLVDNNTLFIGERNGMVISKNEDGSITFNGTASADIFYNLVNLSIPIGHKVALTGVDNMSPFTFFLNGGIGNTLTSSGILTCSHIGTNGNGWMFLYITANTTFNNVTINPKIHYLTQMFGIGNEPTTIEEFRALYPNSNYPYNPGELRNLDCSGIKTVGFNLLDEDVMTSWSGITKDNRGWYGDVSNFYKDSSNNRNKLWVNTMGYTGQICVYIKSTAVDARTGFRPQIHYIDGTTNSYDDSVVLSKEKTSAEGYIVSDENKVVDFVGFSYGDIGYVIVNNFCINLHHTGYRDGEYEPYKEVTYALPQIPLCKAGSVYDEINETEYIIRVGVVDLGSLTYRKSDNFPNLFISNPFGAAGADADKIANLFCPKYIAMTAYDPWRNIISMGMDTSKQLYIYDPQYTDIEVFKSAMSGVRLNYELAEPIVIPIEAPIDFNYYVEDFGTEEALLTEDSAPFNADIIYQFNAVDRIRQNDININRLDKELLLKSDTWHTHSEYATTTALNDLISDIEDNELIISTIVTKINDSCGFNEDSESVLPNGQNLTEAIEELSGAVNDIIEEIIDNELVTSTAISTMNASAGFNEDGSSVLEGGVSLSQAIIDLQNNGGSVPMTSITYSELKTLRDEGKLIPGMKYRITDYNTTTSQEGTSSAGHQFDVIVTALDNKTLSEEASACLHDGDTYFSSANAKLEVWKLWYCLDNDTDRFAWADTENGKGVIYRMIDEGRNDLPYDFKNIMFRRYKLNAPESVDSDPVLAKMSEIIQAQFLAGTLSYIWCGFFADENRYWNDNYEELYSTTTGEYMDFYTFSDVISGVVSDISLNIFRCYDNVMGRAHDLTCNVFFSDNDYSQFSSNSFGIECCCNSFGNNCGNNSFGDGCCYNSFGNDCTENTFGKLCIKNLFGTACSNNSFGVYCCGNAFRGRCNSNLFGNVFFNNSFGDDCYNNSFGSDCTENTFGTFCENNSFGNKCYNNLFREDCKFNSFGNECYNNLFREDCKFNSFGNECYNNLFGNECHNNSFGDKCCYNSFGNDCYNNSFGNYCSNNLFGTFCENNSFGESCQYINFGESSSVLNDYYSNNSFGNSCKFINLVSSGSSSSGNRVQNYKFTQGLQGNSSTQITITAERNRGYETKVAKNSAGEIKIYCEADLIA